MTYGGGTYAPGIYNKILPGVYTTSKSKTSGTQFKGISGTVALPIQLVWGPSKEVFKVSAQDFFGKSFEIFGLLPTNYCLLPIYEIFLGGAKDILVYNLRAGGTKAKSATTINGESTGIEQIAVARHAGTRGNDLSTAIIEFADDETKMEVQTLIDGIVIDRQIISAANGIGNWNDLKDNAWIVWDRTIVGGLVEHESVPLVGGVDGTATGQATTDFRDEIMGYEFDTCVYGGLSPSENGIFASWCINSADNFGKKFRMVLYNTSSDHERIINVTSKSTMTDDFEYGFIYFTAGLDASTLPGKSCTNATYTGVFKLTKNPSQEELTTAVTAGQFVYHIDGDRTCVLTDLNSFTSFSDEKSRIYSKPSTIRLLDFFEKEVEYLFKRNFLGKVPMDENGLDSLKGQIINVGNALVNMRAVKRYNTDSVELETDGVDVVIARHVLEPSGTMEKLYLESVLE